MTNSLVGKMWNEKRSPCPVCKAVGWDDIHALYGCVCLSDDEVKVELNKEVSDNKDGDLCWYIFNCDSRLY